MVPHAYRVELGTLRSFSSIFEDVVYLKDVVSTYINLYLQMSLFKDGDMIVFIK